MSVIEFIKSSVPVGWKHTASGWTTGNCPMCVRRGHRADTRKRGGLNFDNDGFFYNCFNCGFKAGWQAGEKITKNLSDLLIAFGVDPADIQRIKLELMKANEQDQLIEELIKKSKPKIVSMDWKQSSLPEKSYPIDSVPTNVLNEIQLQKFVDACTYIEQRKLSFHGDWFWSWDKKYINRIILPFRYNNQIVGHTARWVGIPPSKTTSKYLLNVPKNFVFNLDNQESHQYVIVTEGPYDALITGGVAVNTNDINQTQADIIDKLNKQVILLPDLDPSGKKMINTALNRGWAVSFPEWKDCKDANDALLKYGRLFVVSSILNSAEINSVKIQLLGKKYCS